MPLTEEVIPASTIEEWEKIKHDSAVVESKVEVVSCVRCRQEITLPWDQIPFDAIMHIRNFDMPSAGDNSPNIDTEPSTVSADHREMDRAMSRISKRVRRDYEKFLLDDTLPDYTASESDFARLVTRLAEIPNTELIWSELTNIFKIKKLSSTLLFSTKLKELINEEASKVIDIYTQSAFSIENDSMIYDERPDDIIF
jgi:hypothetical protein